MPDFSDLDFAKVDVGRLERRGFPEAAFAEGKSPDDLTKILEMLVEKNGVALATRAKPNQYKKVIQSLPDARFESVGRCIVIERKPLPRLPRKIAVVSAGTTDRPVIEEARVTLGAFREQRRDHPGRGRRRNSPHHRSPGADRSVFGSYCCRGNGRGFTKRDRRTNKQTCDCRPTSVGYGASFGGIAALLGMLNSCASGVTVVNIDNGFGAAYAASLINREIGRPDEGK